MAEHRPPRRCPVRAHSIQPPLLRRVAPAASSY